jgi:glycopeptide antibiotics resistance protein
VKQFSLWLFTLGFLVLGLGTLIYVVLRPQGSSYLSLYFSFYQSLPSLPFINNLPSFFHTFAFSLLLASVLPQSKHMLQVCLFWLGLNISFELLQYPGLFETEYLPTILERYAGGRFDYLDMIASALGALAAYGIIWLWQRGEHGT